MTDLNALIETGTNLIRRLNTITTAEFKRGGDAAERFALTHALIQAGVPEVALYDTINLPRPL